MMDEQTCSGGLYIVAYNIIPPFHQRVSHHVCFNIELKINSASCKLEDYLMIILVNF